MGDKQFVVAIFPDEAAADTAARRSRTGTSSTTTSS